MPDGSGKIINGELVAKQNIANSVNTRITDWMDAVTTWYGYAAPANFPVSMLESGATFTPLSNGEIPTTNPDSYVDHNDIGPVINSFCDQFTLLRKCQFRKYEDQRPNGAVTPVYTLISTDNGYAKFLDNPTVPVDYTLSGNTITEGVVSGDYLNNNIDTDDPIRSGTPYTAFGFNEFIDDIYSQLTVTSEDLVTIDYFYCHSQCHSNCHSNCSHSFSDIRLKTNIKEMYEYLPGVPLVMFNWKKDPTGTKVIGVIAQDVNKAYPELVELDKDGFMMVNYCELRKYKEKYSNVKLADSSAFIQTVG